jgi:ATP-binding cassette subfamily B protein
MSFPVYKQLDSMDCGPTCLRMVARHYGKSYSLQTLRERSFITRLGVSLLGVSDAAETIGIRTLGARLTFEQLAQEVPLPCIVHWKQDHFVIVYKIKKDQVYVADPGHGLITCTRQEFLANWLSTKREGEDRGVALLLEPTPDFYTQEDESVNKSSFFFLFAYLKPYKRYIAQLFFGMLTGSLLQLIFPFLTQALVDVGITHQNLDFIYLVLIAQVVLSLSRMSVNFIRGWILLHISTRINISIISDFLIKLMRLPVGFFDIKMIGDLKQRIEDHHRIEAFLTSSTLSILFSLVNLLVFGIVLAIYNLKILGIFLIGSVLYVLWIVLFLNKRRELDFKRFAQLSENQSNIIQLITGMQEIKLNNCEKQKRWEWENIQAKLFKVNVKSLSLRQYQSVGAFSIHQTKNILITFLAAKAVMDGSMTLGMMLAVQYILGQLNSPIEQMIEFLHTA